MTLLYSREHQWIDLTDPADSPVGITAHAQQTLGDIVYVELPEVGKTFRAGEIAAVVESVKAASDVFMPMGGEIIAVNEALRSDPSLVNSDPTGAGWFFRVRTNDNADTTHLIDEITYNAHAGD